MTCSVQKAYTHPAREEVSRVGIPRRGRWKRVCVTCTVFHIFVYTYVDDHLEKLAHGATGKRMSDVCMLLTHFLANMTTKNVFRVLVKKDAPFPPVSFASSLSNLKPERIEAKKVSSQRSTFRHEIFSRKKYII